MLEEPVLLALPPSERPRERMLTLGARSLAEAELIAILLGSGTRTRAGSQSAVAVARSILARFGSIRCTGSRDPREWMQVTGVGKAGACRLGAAFELGRRVASSRSGDRMFVREPADVARLVAPRLRDLAYEEFRVVLLNTAGAVLGDDLVSRGGLAASIVEPRAVFRRAILQRTAAVICVHNHPSGNPEPSREDIQVTRQLAEAGRIMGIPLRDHVIVAGDGFTSLAERGIL